MIDPEWLAQAAMMAETPISGHEANDLAQELGDEREVLPWLLLTRSGFSGWPEARAALAEADKAIIRPRALMQSARGGLLLEQSEACKDAQLRAIAASQEADRWAVDDTIRIRQRVSSRARPNDFIGTF
ncbi:hypothetical protein GVM20_13810 [Porphyrobacter sp. SLTP]|jgi:hypothetical protein|uniref:hypothetical protein n=1 Tax=Porphyrobacter sp. SLTP TaxID=2683266 RepID=UPI00141345D5|nr:hypothetical protein [Porphyrobacter sp. SLTP]NBB26205.1 hypothetical protein [Porphyrobacter sp. SLTP]